MKRIIVCCDGTWNKPGMMDRGQRVETNVEKIYKAVRTKDSGTRQVKFYGPGVGTSYAISEILLGGGTGMGIDKNIQDAYKFLMWSYEPGDEIYMFGFSRGAYTVRSLAGFIRNCGIMKPEYLRLVPEAYHLYRDRTELTHPDCDTMRSFKQCYGIEAETPVTFIGVWDTVGALGIPLPSFNWWNKKYQFHDVKLSSQIKYAYHAIAMDERRRVFQPTLWELTDGDSANGQICEQVWFPGSHGNVGGGYVDAGLSNIALSWMIDRAKEAGVEFDEEYVKQQAGNAEGELRESLNFVYRLFGQLVRKINDIADGREERQKIKRNERIHLSCIKRYHLIEKYYPKNLELAVKKGADFDPVKDTWKPEWLEYLTDF
ncbi:MAG: DUF2235 domain-containing protein [Chitinophagaceae bacterium]|nr:DUF2235 domain-containing protein [Chitinophagaceae bacterium]